jgi:1,2-diacylglycerol 3-beta-galactosyltransferase
VANNVVAQHHVWSVPTPMPLEGRLPTVAILMADSGGGHRAAARSIAEALEGRANVTLLNLLDDFTPFPFNHLSPVYGPWVNHAPGLYHLVYKATEDRKQVLIAEKASYPWLRRKLRLAFDLARPDMVISVHPLLTGVPLRVLREMGNRSPFMTVVTDPISVHPAWFAPKVDLCIVATEEARSRGLATGMDPRRIRVIGLPIRRGFAAARGQDRSVVRARLGLSPTLPLVLLTGGGAGIGKVLPLARTMVRRLADAGVPCQMAIIAGRNAELLRKLRAEPWPIPVTPLGFVENMPEWLAATDLLVSKAGPGTLAEATCMGVPVLITGFIKGQESGNAEWIVDSGAGAFAQEPERVAELTATWLEPGSSVLSDMAERASRMSRPDASVEIARCALTLYRHRSTVHGHSEKIGALG